MTRARLWPAVVLAAGLFAVTNGSSAQQPAGGRPGTPSETPAGREAAVTLVPKSVGAFVTLKVSDLATHPDLKPVLADLAKQPDALAGLTEVIGVSPLEVDRVTLFWPRLSPVGAADPILVLTTREPFNEARVLKVLRADPVFDGDFRRDRGRSAPASSGAKMPKRPADPGPAGHDTNKTPAPKMPGVEGTYPKGIKPSSVAPPPVQSPGVADSPGSNVRVSQPARPPALAPEHLDENSSGAGPGDPLFYTLDRGTFAALFLIDGRTLVLLPGGRDGEMANMALLAAMFKKNASGPLAASVATAGRHTFAAGASLAPVFREIDRGRGVPRELVPYTALFAARTAVLAGDLDKSARLVLNLSFEDAAAARRAAPVLEEGIATVAEKIGEFIDAAKDRQRPVDKAGLPLVTAFAAGLKKAAVKADGSTVVASTEIEAGPALAKSIGALLQVVQSRKKAEKRSNNLKQIGLALHAYHDATGKLPANVYGPKGEPLLSWRVLLLPYLEEQALYVQFKMDEPWDGPTNRALIDKMPNVFTAPDREHAKGKTFYQGFVGSDPAKTAPPKGIDGRPWLIAGDKNGITFLQIFDGTTNTLAVIEARDGVIWSKPEDLPFGGAVPALGEKGSDRTPALWFDGHVSLFPTNLKPLDFWPFVTVNGGEVTPPLDSDGRLDRARPTAPDREERRTDRMSSPEFPVDPTVYLLRSRKVVQRREVDWEFLGWQLAVSMQRSRSEFSDLVLELQKARVADTTLAVDVARTLFAAGTGTAEEVIKAEGEAKRAELLATVLRLRSAWEHGVLAILRAKLDTERKAASTEK
jgi:hypothetical protein